MTPAFWRLGWRSLGRDLRSGDLRLLIAAVSLAVAALTAVSFFTDRLQRGMLRDARQLLGGDAVLVSDNPPPPQFEAKAQDLGLQFVSSLGFPTMARSPEAQGGASKLIALKAVQAGYPLRGKLRVADHPDGKEILSGGIPARGEAWIDAALLAALDLNLGDSLLLGASRFRLAKIIIGEPDRGAGFMNMAPRVMLNQADVEATELIQPASRVSYRLALAGEDKAVAAFVSWSSLEIKRPEIRGVRIESIESGRPEMAKMLERAEKFMSLVALLAALLCAVAVALSARSFASSQIDSCAMLRVLGLRQATMAGSYAFEFGLAGLLASGLGLLLGWSMHHLFVLFLAGLVESSLPAAGYGPVGLGLGTGLMLMLAFGLPPILQLAQVPPLRAIRRDVGPPRLASLGVLFLGLLGFSALLLLLSQDLRMSLVVVCAYFGSGIVFAGLSWLALGLLRRFVQESSAPYWLLLATRGLTARPFLAVLQISALALSLMALVLLVLLRFDLVNSWKNTSPVDAPNRFVINVMPQQAQEFQQSLRAAGVPNYDWYPMIRGRLLAVNGKLVRAEDYADDRAKRLLEREFNLSHNAQQPPNNQVVAGRWLAGETDALSVETGLAKTLKLQLGDRLRFDMGGVQTEARITSLRKVDWASMRANFFVIYPVSHMEDVPLSYMSAFKAPVTPGFDNRLVQRYPNITLVDMSANLAQIQRVMGQVVLAVEFLFGFTLAAGVLVLFATLTASRDQRAREFALMRALGASSHLLRQVQRAELAGVGFLAGALASVVAGGVGWVLAKTIFDFDWVFSPWVLLLGALSGGVLALCAGWWALRGILRQSVVQTLREAPQ